MTKKMWAWATLTLWLTITSIVKSKAVPYREIKDYWEERQEVLEEDLSNMIGHDVTLTLEEEAANSILMEFKWKEYDDGFTSDANFPPARNFFLSKSDIDSSSVYNIIKDMPKGAVLHTHDTAMTSIDWVVQTLTYWPDLYMCTTDGLLMFNFFDTPNTDCDWQNVQDERQKFSTEEEFDAMLTNQLSLFTDDPEQYDTINDVWSAFESKLISISGIVGYKEACKQYLSRAFLEYSQDGISYMEFRGVLPQLYEKNGTVLSSIETFKIYEEIINTFTAEHQHTFIGVKFIYAPLRRVDDNSMWDIVYLADELYRTFPDTVAGFDLVGQEDRGVPLKNFMDQLLFIKEKNVPVFFHAGETFWEDVSTDENLVDAILLNTTRIGHGYAITKHPKLKALAFEKDIPLEVCPISNQVLMLVSDLRNHPATALIKEGFPIVISSDDPGTWGASPISYDFYEAFMGLAGRNADLRFLKKIAMNSIKYSSLDAGKKAELHSMWEDQWNKFITSVNNLAPLTLNNNC